MKTLRVTGSYGFLIVDRATGEVITYTRARDQTAEYSDILCLDLCEWRTWTAANVPADLKGRYLDIAEVGFWTDTGEYFDASEEWREERLEGLLAEVAISA